MARERVRVVDPEVKVEVMRKLLDDFADLREFRRGVRQVKRALGKGRRKRARKAPRRSGR